MCYNVCIVFSMIFCSSYVRVTIIVMWFLAAVVLLQLWFYIYVCGYLLAAVVMLLQLWLCCCSCGYDVAAVKRRGARAVPG